MKVLSLQPHGLLRSSRNEFGRNPDTGGQTSYVLELAKALGKKGVSVDLVTRLIDSPGYDHSYSLPTEEIPDSEGKARIVRLEYGSKEEFIPKEQLWHYLPQLIKAIADFYNAQDNFGDKNKSSYPDIIHSHYADAGFVGLALKRSFFTPLFHTTHSLGLSKLQKFLSEERPLDNLNLPLRLMTEARLFLDADAIITSTEDEKRKWTNYAFPYSFPEFSRLIGDVSLIKRMSNLDADTVPFSVIPPGINSERFFPGFTAKDFLSLEEKLKVLDNQLQEPSKRPILSVTRIDPTKNVLILIEAYLKSGLREKANLVIGGGSSEFKNAAEAVLSGRDFSSLGISEYEADVLHFVGENLPLLKGRIAFLGFVDFEKEVAPLYRYAARQGGVFANTTLYESFGLTVIEAMACGLPTCATKNGGPAEIIASGVNGYLLEPTSLANISNTIQRALALNGERDSLIRRASQLVARKYSWDFVAEQHLDLYSSQLLSANSARRSYFIPAVSAPAVYQRDDQRLSSI